MDILSTRALNEVLQKRGAENTQTSALYEMHGRLVDTICTSCEHKETNLVDTSLCPALAAAGLPPSDTDGGDDDKVANIPLEELPRCKQCSGLLRPAVVWFGETPLHMPEINALVDEADMCLVVGTSSTVRPTTVSRRYTACFP